MGRYPLEVFWSDEDEGFIAEAPDLPGCSAFGTDEAEAVREAQDAIASWIEAAKADGREIPPPSTPEPLQAYSGKFVVRVGRQLHARLARKAQTDGLSLNQYMLKLVAANSSESAQKASRQLIAFKAAAGTSIKSNRVSQARKSAKKPAAKRGKKVLVK